MILYRVHSNGGSGQEIKVFSTVPLPQGATTGQANKLVTGDFQKRRTLICVLGDRQIEDVDFDSADIYSSVLKATKVRRSIFCEAWCSYPQD